MIHEWMGSRHRLLREAAGEHMGSCSLRDLDPRGEVEGRELNCRQRQVSEWTRTSQLSTKYFSQPVPNISLNCHLQLAPSLSLSGIGHMARWSRRSPAALTEWTGWEILGQDEVLHFYDSKTDNLKQWGGGCSYLHVCIFETTTPPDLKELVLVFLRLHNKKIPDLSKLI